MQIVEDLAKRLGAFDDLAKRMGALEELNKAYIQRARARVRERERKRERETERERGGGDCSISSLATRVSAVSFELDRLVNPPTERPSAPPVGCMIFLERIDIKDQEEQKKLLDAGIRLKDDLLDLEMEDLADVFKDLALSTRKRLKRFVHLAGGKRARACR
jgi:hypothetical protein